MPSIRNLADESGQARKENAKYIDGAMEFIAPGHYPASNLTERSCGQRASIGICSTASTIPIPFLNCWSHAIRQLLVFERAQASEPQSMSRPGLTHRLALPPRTPRLTLGAQQIKQTLAYLVYQQVIPSGHKIIASLAERAVQRRCPDLRVPATLWSASYSYHVCPVQCELTGGPRPRNTLRVRRRRSISAVTRRGSACSARRWVARGRETHAFLEGVFGVR